jgi:hypothetical protein
MFSDKGFDENIEQNNTQLKFNLFKRNASDPLFNLQLVNNNRLSKFYLAITP